MGIDNDMEFLDALNKGMEKAEDYVFEFECPICKGKAKGMWRYWMGKKSIARGMCEGCGMWLVV